MRGPQPQPQRGGPGVTVDRAQVAQNVHGGYGQVIATLMQENAELLAGLQTMSAENAEMKARVEALAGASGVVTLQQPAASGG